MKWSEPYRGEWLGHGKWVVHRLDAPWHLAYVWDPVGDGRPLCYIVREPDELEAYLKLAKACEDPALQEFMMGYWPTE